MSNASSNPTFHSENQSTPPTKQTQQSNPNKAANYTPPQPLLSTLKSPPYSPFLITTRSNASLLYARFSILVSTESAVHSRITITGDVYPILWHLSIACMSWCGFQSESYMMHVSAAVRLMPRPPARVDSRNMFLSVLVLNSWIWAWRSTMLTEPSRRKASMPCCARYVSRMSNMRVIWGGGGCNEMS